MKLDKLYGSGRNLLSEAKTLPPSRLPNPEEFSRISLKFEPTVNPDQVIEDSALLGEEDNWKDAYFSVKDLFNKNLISGLSKVQPHDLEDYNRKFFYIAADIDNLSEFNKKMTHMGSNHMISRIGQLLAEQIEAQYDPEFSHALTMEYGSDISEVDYATDRKYLEGGVSRTSVSHPHGDEFEIITEVTNLDHAQRGEILLNLTMALMNVSNSLAKIGWHYESNENVVPNHYQQATISFAISDSKEKANMILHKTKQQVKYSVILDSNLIQEFIYPFKEYRYQLEALTSGVDLMVSEDKSALDAVMNKPGCLLLELNPVKIPRPEQLELQETLSNKRGYLANPGGVLTIPISSGYSYYPLKEPCNSVFI